MVGVYACAVCIRVCARVRVHMQQRLSRARHTYPFYTVTVPISGLIGVQQTQRTHTNEDEYSSSEEHQTHC